MKKQSKASVDEAAFDFSWRLWGQLRKPLFQYLYVNARMNRPCDCIRGFVLTFVRFPFWCFAICVAFYILAAHAACQATACTITHRHHLHLNRIRSFLFLHSEAFSFSLHAQRCVDLISSARQLRPERACVQKSFSSWADEQIVSPATENKKNLVWR